MNKLILIVAIIFSGMLMQAQSSVTLKSYEMILWDSGQVVGSNNTTQQITFTNNSVTAGGTKASLKSKSGWGNSMGDSYITLYDHDGGTFELYVSGTSFQLTITSGTLMADYTGDISQSQLQNLKTIY